MALTQDRDTQSKNGEVFEFTPAAGAVLFRGALGAINAAGLAVPVSATAGLTVVGRVEAGSADGVIPTPGIVTVGPSARIRIRRGACFAFDNSTGADALTAADWGKPCYAVDDHTLARTDGGGTRPLAGTFRGVDQFGAWVQI